jgi:UDP-N-acetyl-D-glucosamine dehydrogenase
VQSRENKFLAIIGQGYVGLPLAMAAINAGWNVVGIDTSSTRVTMLNSGTSPVEDVSDLHLITAIEKKRYLATSDFSAISQASVVAICVPTPLDENREPDLSALKNAAFALAPYLSNKTLVVSESTSYPGTLRKILIPIIDQNKPVSSPLVYFACAPERVNPGDIKWNQLNTPRLIGGINPESVTLAKDFYNSICDNGIVVSTPEVAEAAKLLENTFRLVNIALINEFAKLCHIEGIDVNEVVDAASTKPYGFMPFKPGVGVGGHCIPIDPLYLTWWARQNGLQAELVEKADFISNGMPHYVANRAMSLVSLSNSKPRILIVGVAYKPGVSDTRETPVLALFENLIQFGAQVKWHDPLVSLWRETSPVDLSWEYDVAILATAQPGVNLNKLVTNGKPILDCTNTLDSYPNVTKL